ncbi:uroporphyrinogen-III synthase [Vibrio sp. AK197]|uniref:Uroporphyrinogen-III synthase n=1 Tax=Vibrio olivae TaxID=1243002 RepID=A0ABV5HT80_9VIBR
MAVLVTRPGAQGYSLCQQLMEAGIASFHHSLLTFTPGSQLSQLSDDIEQIDIMVAISQHSVAFTDEYFTQHNISWPQDCHYLAIGHKTALELSRVCGQKVNYPQQSDSEHFLELDDLQDINKKQIVILRGNGGRELIFDTLVERGAIVEYREVYQREYRDFDAEVLVAQWQQAHIDTVVITSSGQLNFFASKIAEVDLHWLYSLKLIVPSDRIAKEANAMGFHIVSNTGSAANSDLLATLQPNIGQ